MNTYIFKILLIDKYNDLYYDLCDAMMRGWYLLGIRNKIEHDNWFSRLVINYIIEFPQLINIRNIHKFLRYEHIKCDKHSNKKMYCMCRRDDWLIKIKLNNKILIINEIIEKQHKSSIVYITELTEYEKLGCGWRPWDIKDKNAINKYLEKNTLIKYDDVKSYL